MWSWVLGGLGVTGLWLVGSRRRWGWCVAAFNEVLWIVYSFETKQWGFIPAALAYGVVHARNYRRGAL